MGELINISLRALPDFKKMFIKEKDKQFIAIQYMYPNCETWNGLHCALGGNGVIQSERRSTEIRDLYVFRYTHRRLMNVAYITATPT